MIYLALACGGIIMWLIYPFCLHQHPCLLSLSISSNALLKPQTTSLRYQPPLSPPYRPTPVASHGIMSLHSPHCTSVCVLRHDVNTKITFSLPSSLSTSSNTGDDSTSCRTPRSLSCFGKMDGDSFGFIITPDLFIACLCDASWPSVAW